MGSKRRTHGALLFAAPAVAGVLIGLDACRTHRAIESIERAGGTVTRRPIGAPWLRRAVYAATGRFPDVLDPVESVSFRLHPDVAHRALASLVSEMRVFRSLQLLDLGGTSADVDVMRQVARLPSLQRLDLTRTDLAAQELALLCGLKNLRQLSLANTQVGDADLEYLLKLEQLEVLDLDGTRITDRGMFVVRKLPRLRSLSVSNTEVTDVGLGVLWEERPEVAVADD